MEPDRSSTKARFTGSRVAFCAAGGASSSTSTKRSLRWVDRMKRRSDRAVMVLRVMRLSFEDRGRSDPVLLQYLAGDRDEALDPSLLEPAQRPAHVKLDVRTKGESLPLGPLGRL